VVSELAIELRGDHLGRGALGTPDDGDDTWAVLVQPASQTCQSRTHRHNDAEKATDDPVNQGIEGLVGGGRAVERMVGFRDAEAEEVGLFNQEAQVLIEDLRNMLRGSCRRGICGEVFESSSGQAAEAVDLFTSCKRSATPTSIQASPTYAGE
jgi:hypothetical protein